MVVIRLVRTQLRSMVIIRIAMFVAARIIVQINVQIDSNCEEREIVVIARRAMALEIDQQRGIQEVVGLSLRSQVKLAEELKPADDV